MKQFLIKFNDINYIHDRIKDINPNYSLFYNKLLKRYEIHDMSNLTNTYCISFERYPDRRVLDKLYKTKKSNMSKLFKEIEEQNNKLQQKQEDNLIDKAKVQVNEIIKYSSMVL